MSGLLGWLLLGFVAWLLVLTTLCCVDPRRIPDNAERHRMQANQDWLAEQEPGQWVLWAAGLLVLCFLLGPLALVGSASSL